MSKALTLSSANYVDSTREEETETVTIYVEPEG